VTDNFPEIAINLNNADLVIADTHGNKLASFYDGEFKTKMFDTANTPKQDDASADLDISDENDNVLVRFKNGHIRTKNFDSANIGYKNLEGIKFSILGDSISTFQGYIPTGYAYFYPAGNLTNVADTWWQKLAQHTELTLLKNCSWSGSDMCGDSTSTTNAQAGCSTKRISDLADNGINPDIVIVYIGINDFYHAGNITLGTWTPKNEIPSEGIINHFSEAYALCIHKIMIAYPDAEIYCCSLLECKTADTDNRYPVINTNGEYLLDFNNRIKEIAEGLGVYFIDVHSCGINYWNGYGDTLVDTTHPNVKGAGLVSRCISNAILTLTKKYQ
jgi:lysophospholipase L1-like esterase